MRTCLSMMMIGFLATACGGRTSDQAAAPGPAAAEPAGQPAAAQAAAVAASPTDASGAGKAGAPAPGLDGRTGELLNPDDSTMVFLYQDLAGIPVALDSLVEADTRVQFADPADKQGRREAVRAELETAIAGVRGIGFLRLSTDGKLSRYDPNYEEFTIGTLSPSSTFNFKAHRQDVAVRFGNARHAQVWRVPKAESQALIDRIGSGDTSLDVLLRITGVQPAPGGGTIMTDVVEYELRERQTSSVLARVQVGAP